VVDRESIDNPRW